jgi:hypothetical protein
LFHLCVEERDKGVGKRNAHLIYLIGLLNRGLSRRLACRQGRMLADYVSHSSASSLRSGPVARYALAQIVGQFVQNANMGLTNKKPQHKAGVSGNRFRGFLGEIIGRTA